MLRRRKPSPKSHRASRDGVLVESVAETLRRRIQQGRYAPAQRLIEAELTRELRVSRGPVREALRRLAAEGLVELEPHRGASVHGLSRADVLDLVDVLEVLATLAARLVAERSRDPEVRRQVDEALAATRAFRRRAARSHDVLPFMEENARFHTALTALSGNRVLARILPQLQIHFFRLASHGRVSHADRGLWTAGHTDILEATLAGDPREAERKMRAYARGIRGLLLSLADSAFDRGPAR